MDTTNNNHNSSWHLFPCILHKCGSRMRKFIIRESNKMMASNLVTERIKKWNKMNEFFLGEGKKKQQFIRLCLYTYSARNYSIDTERKRDSMTKTFHGNFEF